MKHRCPECGGSDLFVETSVFFRYDGETGVADVTVQVASESRLFPADARTRCARCKHEGPFYRFEVLEPNGDPREVS